jgi:hypothetical protein
LLGKTGKLVLRGVCAKNDEDLLPVLQVGVLNHISQIISGNGLIEAKVW